MSGFAIIILLLRGHWDFQFFGSGHFLRFFNFGVFQFAVFLSLALGFQILAKIQAVFQTWYPMCFFHFS